VKKNCWTEKVVTNDEEVTGSKNFVVVAIFDNLEGTGMQQISGLL
jgi:hypothetical protein